MIFAHKIQYIFVITIGLLRLHQIIPLYCNLTVKQTAERTCTRTTPIERNVNHDRHKSMYFDVFRDISIVKRISNR